MPLCGMARYTFGKPNVALSAPLVEETMFPQAPSLFKTKTMEVKNYRLQNKTALLYVSYDKSRKRTH